MPPQKGIPPSVRFYPVILLTASTQETSVNILTTTTLSKQNSLTKMRFILQITTTRAHQADSGVGKVQ